MRNAARHGRGTFTYIGSPREVAARMEALLTALEHPVMSDVTLAWPSPPGSVESWPSRVPDLYAGEPLMVAAAIPGPSGEVTVRGAGLDAPWKQALSLFEAKRATGIARLWARRKITALMDSRIEGAEETSVRPAVVKVALEHELTSRYTSFVAVDVAPARPVTASLRRTAVPTRLPRGWDHEKVFGRLPRTAMPARLQLLVGSSVLASGLLGLAWRRRARRSGANRRLR